MHLVNGVKDLVKGILTTRREVKHLYQQNTYNMKKQLLTLLTVCSALAAVAQIPENGLVAYYSFDNNITDEHTRNYKALSVNNRETAYQLSETAKFGKSLLTSVSDNSDCLYRNDSALQFKTSFTISTWIKISGTTKPSGWGTIVGNRRNQNESIYNNFMLTTNYNRGSGIKVHFYISDSLVESPDDIDSSWHHLVAVYNAGNGKLYVDGILKGERNDLPVSINYGTPDATTLVNMLQIGNVNGINNSSFNNLIDELALYNRALSAAEIQSLYTATSNDLVVLKQQWEKIVSGEKNRVDEVTAKNGNYIGYIRIGQNFVLDIGTGNVEQEYYQPNTTAADQIHISSNGHALIKNGNNLFYYAGSNGYIDISNGEIATTALNATAAYKIGSKGLGLYKYTNGAWATLDDAILVSKISVADDGTIAILSEEGNPAISTGTDLTFNFNTSFVFTEITIASANLAFATKIDGSIYKYTPSTGWVLFNSLPAMSKISVANDGNLFGISNGSVYRFHLTSTGLKESENQLAFSVYPNPSNDIISINSIKEIKSIAIVNLIGDVVKTIQNQTEINVSELSNGIYMLHVTDANGHGGVQKIVIAH